jgi:parvulin-like peptidyl-prolyl isomerase
MTRPFLILGLLAALGCGVAPGALAQTQASSAGSSNPSSVVVPGISRNIDGIAARIEDSIITESEVRELGAFQQLVDGHSKSRDEIIRELADQWVVRQEAAATNYKQPSDEAVNAAYKQLMKQFASPAEFQNRLDAVGLSEPAVRRLLRAQLYLSRFLDYRFRPAAQVDEKQIQAYYDNELVPQLKKRGEKIPPLDDVEDTIREVLIQRAIDDHSAKWLDETRERLKIEIVPPGDAS